ncbi:hypothetical protein ACFX1Z_025162 [Malus domestica]
MRFGVYQFREKVVKLERNWEAATREAIAPSCHCLQPPSPVKASRLTMEYWVKKSCHFWVVLAWKMALKKLMARVLTTSMFSYYCTASLSLSTAMGCDGC